MNRPAASNSLSAAVIFAAALLAGCAIHPLPTEELAHARAAVAQATVATAAGPSTPEAGRAQAKLALAQRWVDAKDYGPALWLAEQAEVDAELALARVATREARTALALREQARVAIRKVSGQPL